MVIGDSSAPTIGILGYQNSVIQDVHIQGFATNWEIVNSRMITFKECSAWNSGFVGAHTNLNIFAVGAFSGDLIFETCQFVSNHIQDSTNSANKNVRIGVESGVYNNSNGNNSVAGIKFKSCVFYSGDYSIDILCSNSGLVGDIWFDSGCQIDQQVTRGVNILSTGTGSNIINVHFDGLYINQATEPQILLLTSDFGEIKDIWIDNCYLTQGNAQAVSVLGSQQTIFGITVANNIIEDNNANSGAIYMQNAVNFSITGNKTTKAYLNRSPLFVIDLQPGCDNFTCSYNDGLGNVDVSTIRDDSGDVTKFISNNLGYNPLPPALITVGASPFTYKNITGNTSQVIISDGTITNVSVNGLVIPINTYMPLLVPAGGSVVVEYSVAPTMRIVPT
jgi:hypothetical protein